MKLQRQLLAAGIGSSRWKGSSSSTANKKKGEELLYVVEPLKGSSSTMLATAAAGSSPAGAATTTAAGGVVLRRTSAAAAAAAASDSAAAAQDAAAASAGFSVVLELLRAARKPVVAHNSRFDVAFSLAAFVATPLPRTWGAYKRLVASWFPGGWVGWWCARGWLAERVHYHHACTTAHAPSTLRHTHSPTGGLYDTKHLARVLSGARGDTKHLLPDTSLGGLFRVFNASAAAQQVCTAGACVLEMRRVVRACVCVHPSLGTLGRLTDAALHWPARATRTASLSAHCSHAAAAARASRQRQQQQQQQQRPTLPRRRTRSTLSTWQSGWGSGHPVLKTLLPGPRCRACCTRQAVKRMQLQQQQARACRQTY
jgi:hypothetical protein